MLIHRALRAQALLVIVVEPERLDVEEVVLFEAFLCWRSRRAKSSVCAVADGDFDAGSRLPTSPYLRTSVGVVADREIALGWAVLALP
jgi:hypothetical protein